MRQQDAIDRAKQIRLDFGEDVLVFTFSDPKGDQWEGCLDEWIGNDSFARSSDEVLEHNGRRYIAVGASGGGADLVLVRDDCCVCYLNDYDSQVSQVAGSVDEFVALLRNPS